ncbi:MAG TPA: protein-L-isoaspartate(D-aspartate) O-methyltransferase [Burkholderiaceae bacterium]|nr:protein-L-isoaspartate(D-aspartate) O-methyltransferase [Burkholderiaceae bacterium]
MTASGRPRVGQAAENQGLASARVREKMVERVRELGVHDARVLSAMAAVPRHAFVDAALASRAYEDTALPIGYGQTISQPYIVARSAELALAGVDDPATAHVLEIGTGCGYAAAVLAWIFGEVYSIERVRALHELARTNLRPLRIRNLRLVLGDGMLGLPSAAPFSAIVAAAAGDDVPSAWLDQLAPRGRIVAPIGRGTQRLCVIWRDAAGRVQRHVGEDVRFVPIKQGTQ